MTGQVQTELPIWLAFIGLMLAVFLSWYGYSSIRSKDLFTKNMRITLGTIRALGFFMVFLLFMGFLWKGKTDITEKPIAIVAVDNSLSMVLRTDSQKLREDISGFIDQLSRSSGSRLDLYYYNFGESVQSGISYDFKDKKTDFGQLFRRVSSVYSGSPVQELFIITDGIYNSGPAPATAARIFPYPVTVWAMGDTLAVPDLKVTDVQVNDLVYAGSAFPVNVRIKGHDLDSYDAKLKIMSDGVSLADTVVRIDSVDGIGSVSMLIRYEKKGIHTFQAIVEPFKNEFNKYNNTNTFSVEIIDEKVKVLLLYHTIHPDIRVFKTSLEETSRYQLDLKKIGTATFNPGEYQLIILYQLPEGSKGENAVLSRIKNSDSNVFFIIGPQTDLRALNAFGVGAGFKADRILTEDYTPVLNERFSLFKTEDGFKDYLNKMPPLKAPFATIKISSRAKILLTQRIKSIELSDPLMWFDLYHGRKYGFLWGEGLWRWQLYEYLINENHYFSEGLIVKAVNYLSTNELNDPLRISIPAVINNTDKLKLSVRLYNKSLETITDPKVYFDISGENYLRKFELRAGQQEYRLEIDELNPGEYNYVCYTNMDNTEYRKPGKIEVFDIPLEHLDMTTRYGELKELAFTGNGKIFYKDESDKLLSYIKNKKVDPEKLFRLTKWNNLINIPYIYLIIIVFFSAEWLLRRWSGTR